LTLNPVAAVNAGDEPVKITVTGQNFSQGLTGIWLNPPDTKSPTLASIADIGDTTMSATFVPGAAGTGRLVITTPANLQAVLDIQVSSGKNPPPAPVQPKATNMA
jgi:hypothetical protein